MLGDQIKKYRKEKKMSQEELAIPLNVVRQTVSKWENNLSVPDAELLIRLAEVLEISVAELLGTDEQPRSESLSAETLAIELARLNEELAKQVQDLHNLAQPMMHCFKVQRNFSKIHRYS